MANEITDQQQKFLRELKAEFDSSAHSDRMSRGLFATDASIYQQTPLAVLAPRDDSELKRAMRLAHEFEIPVLPRAGGTSLAGQTTGEDALVLDISQYMDHLLEVNAAERWAMVEPGMIRDRLNSLLAAQDLMFAPETSTSNRANIAGMIGNNSSGMMSIRYGTTISHVEGCEVMLADGTQTWFGPRHEMDETGNKILDQLLKIVEGNRPLIEERFPKVLRRVGGYSLDAFLGDDPNLAKIMVGSEGTLGFITKARLNLVEKPKVICAVACHFADLIESLRAVPTMVKHNPLSAEFMDGPLLRMSARNPTTAPLMSWYRGDPEAIIPVEFDGESVEECEAKIDALVEDLKKEGYGYEYVKLLDPQERLSILETRKAGLGVMLKMVGDWKPISFIEDACVPVENLADYAQGVIDLAAEEGLKIMSYGHASVGVLHLKPVVNLKTQEDREKCARLSQRVMELCKKYNGAWSGEHGDGIARGAQNELFWGADMIEVFRQVKRIFDPKGVMNPGKIFDTPPVMEPLRYRDSYLKSEYESMFHFREEGGLQGAVEMCNGVGACRKIDSGTMCPSFMATREEKDSTRGRANGLRLALSGQLGPDAFTSKALYDVLDLCLECKACRTECPSNVDMSRMKSEFLHAYHQKHGTKLREKIFAFSPETAKLNSGLLAPIVNSVFAVPLIRKTFNKMLGVAVERELPTYTRQRFQTWFDNRRKPELPEDAPEVVLFDDTYVRYHEPNIGKWAVRVLEQLGYRVIVAKAGCCCRTFISKGFLDEAKKRGERTLDNLDAYARRGLPIVGLEPSCVSSLRGDLADLMDDEDLGKRVAQAVMPIEEFLAKEVQAGRIKIELPNAAEKYLLHGHCHQKALFGTGHLKSLMGDSDGSSRLYEVDSGCCGMAGSFGYEQEHYDLSQRIGESRLFPAVRERGEGVPVISNGFSCRHQVKDATGVKPMHFIEALGRAMKASKPRK